jgi:hypothetical protein
MNSEDRKKAQQKYLDKKKITIEDDDAYTKEVQAKEALAKEALAKEMKEKQETLNKIREEQTKKQVYIQSQMLIIDETIDSFKTDKTDDNIMLILTIIKASIENIQKTIGNDEKKVLLDQVIKFTNEVDKSNTKRPKGINTIANVQILKDGFKQIYDLLDLNVDIQTLDTENDEKIAAELEKELNKKKYPIINHDFIEPDNEYPDEEEPDFPARKLPTGLRPIRPIHPIHPIHPIRPDTDDDGDDDDDEPDTDDDGDDDDEPDTEDDADGEDDATIAKRMQDNWNKPQKKEPIKYKKPSNSSTKYEGLNCEEFMKMLQGEKLS